MIKMTGEISKSVHLGTMGKGSVALIALVAGSFFAPSANAQEIEAEQYVGGKARVNQSAKLRTYSEEVAAASCRLSAGFNSAQAEEDLKRVRLNVSGILTGLRDGNPALGIPTAEVYSANIKSLDAVLGIWSPIESATTNLLSNQSDAASLQTISSSFGEMFEQTALLASNVSGKYSDPIELLQSDAITLNFATRQMVLLTRMERLTCGLIAGNEAFGTAQELKEVMDLFEKSLAALREGFPDAGIPKPPNEAVEGALLAIHDHWVQERALLEDVIANGGDAETVNKVTATTQTLVKDVNNAITLYLIATPGQEGIYRLPVGTYAAAELGGWLSNGELIDAIRAQNVAHAGLAETDIIAKDEEWRAEAKNGGGPLIESLLSHDVSGWLRDQQIGTAGLVTEVFVMDNRGLNVAQSVQTSDYWQGDEAKWQETYAAEDAETHIADIEFDDSTGFYQTQASMPIIDPETNEKIGAITFGINVQSLM
ncbi:MAG: type IV pili methyl-accepting chemotaxis transducer N-terminal domain-containing protein [Paracoccaceae bacterium]